MVKKNNNWKVLFRDCGFVYLDTNILIYFFQDHEKYSALIDKIFEFIELNKLTSGFSALLLAELLVDPFKKDEPDIARNWLSYFKTEVNLEIIDLSPTIAVDAAFLRAKYNIKTPDSIHVATAMQKKGSVFLTNDSELKKIEELKVVCIEDFV